MANSKRTNELTQLQAWDLFCYDERSGKLYWNSHRSSKARFGDEAGTTTSRGYIAVNIDGIPYQAHNIAWVYMNGTIPSDRTVDHIDRCGTNNRLSNLRLATPRQQALNKISAGFCWNKKASVWQAQHALDGKKHHLGIFSMALLARLAYEAHIKKLEPDFAITPFLDALASDMKDCDPAITQGGINYGRLLQQRQSKSSKLE